MSDYWPFNPEIPEALEDESESIEQGMKDFLKEKKTISTERVDKLFNKNRVYVDSPEDVPEQYEVREGNQGGTFYETGSDDLGEIESYDDIQEGDTIQYEGQFGRTNEIEIQNIDEFGLGDVIDVVDSEGKEISYEEDRLKEFIDNGAEFVDRGNSNETESDESEESETNFDENETESDSEQESDDESEQSQSEMLATEEEAKNNTNEFESEVSSETAEEVNDTLSDWTTNWFQGAESLWAAVEEETGNYKSPKSIRTRSVNDEQKEAIQEHKEFTEEKLREEFGDEIEAERVLYGDIAEEILEAVESGESFELGNRTVESWTTDSGFAEAFAESHGMDDVAVSIQTEIPVEDVWASSMTHESLDQEASELVVGQNEIELTPENIEVVQE